MTPVEQVLSGWGNYPRERCRVARPESPAMLTAAVDGGERDYIARGLGRSYGDSALNRDRGVVLLTRLNRFLAFDERTGVLECEAGVSLAEIIEHLLPRGWFPPTTPGTRYVTVGGAIAADVHGKNHHLDGSFGNFVLRFELLTAAGRLVTCSPRENAELFWATVGGMGLTGVIVRAALELVRVPSAYCQVTYRRTVDLDQTLECLAAESPRYRYAVAWVDALRAGRGFGRSVVMLADDARVDELPERLRQRPLELPARPRLAVPCTLPGWTLNPLSVQAFNGWYYARHADGRKLVDYDRFFYPLDAVANWNRVYGRRGFVQYQALFPPETSRRGLIELLQRVARSRRASFLTVLKTCGPATPGLLSFMRPGFTLALDLPRGDELVPLARELDAILLRHGGRLYLAKDALMSAETFAAMYPRLREFRRIKAEVDPNQRFASSQARRLALVEADGPGLTFS